MKKPGDILTDDELIAPAGMTRVIKSSLFPGPDFFVNDFADKDEAIDFVDKANENRTEEDNITHYAYNDSGKLA